MSFPTLPQAGSPPVSRKYPVGLVLCGTDSSVLPPPQSPFFNTRPLRGVNLRLRAKHEPLATTALTPTSNGRSFAQSMQYVEKPCQARRRRKGDLAGCHRYLPVTDTNWGNHPSGCTLGGSSGRRNSFPFHSATILRYRYGSGHVLEGSTTVVSGHSFQLVIMTMSAPASVAARK